MVSEDIFASILFTVLMIMQIFDSS